MTRVARYYENIIGRFLSPDPENAGADPNDPQSWNAYSYAGDNPTTNTDPTGESYRVCVSTMQNTNANCVTIPSNEAFQSALKNPGPGITVQGNNGSGSIFGTDVNGNQVLVGTYQNLIGPGDEGRGLPDQTLNVLAVAGLAEAGVKGIVALGEGVANGIGRMLGEAAINRAVGSEGSAATQAAVDANKLWHIFGKPGHNLGALVETYGSQQAAYNALLQATERTVASKGLTGVFKTTVQVGSDTITVTGKVVNGVVEIGTAYKRP